MTGLPTDLQLDALREVANVGCGHAATALSRLVGGRAVRIDVPRVHAASADVAELSGGLGNVLAASLRIAGDIHGEMLLLWPEQDAHELARLMLGAPEQGPLLEEPQKSALAEAANIVGSACLSAIGTLTQLRLLPTPPVLEFDDARSIISECIDDTKSADAAVVLEAKFYAAHSPPVSGQLLLVPDRAGLPRLFRALGL